MSRPVFLSALDGARPGGVVVVTGEEARHAATVRRLRPGEEVDVVDGAGARVTGTVAAVAPDGVTVAVREVGAEPPPAVALVLVQALAKGDRDELAIEAATEVGAQAVIPWQAERSVSVWAGAKVARGEQRWAAVVRAAAKQARRAWVPTVRPMLRTVGLVRAVRETTAAGGAAVVLHEAAGAPLRAVPLPDRGEVLVVVGPEGGLTEAEVAALSAAGAHVARLGPSVLRTSTAGPVAIALLAERLGHWAAPGGSLPS